MTRNIGKLDRFFRIVVGPVLLAHIYSVPTAGAGLG